MKEWLPDWRNPENYPDPEITSMTEWAWEFLRRNPLYQADYKKLEDGLEKIGFYKAIIAYSQAIQGDDRKKIDEFYEIMEQGKRDIELVKSKYKVEIFEVRGCCLPNPVFQIKKQGVIFRTGNLRFYDFFYDPTGTGKTMVRSFGSIPEEHLNDHVTRGMNKEASLANESTTSPYFEANSRSLVVQISLERPISEQLKMIKKVATAQQKQLFEWGVFEKSRNESRRYGGYLQLLDALEVGAKKQKILDTLFHGMDNEYPDYLADKNFYNWKSAAEKLRDSDYLKLASLHRPAGV